jgi:hypothetical protein
MRFQVILLPFLFLFFLSLSLTAQDPTVKGFCGTSRHDLDAISEQLSANLANLDHIAIERSGAVTYVPIRLFIVQRTDGTGGVELEKFLDMLCGLNEFYAEMDIQFFLKGSISYLKNTGLFDNPMSPSSYTTMVNQRQKGFLNMFLTNETGEANVLAYYTSGWPSWEADLLVIRRSEVASNKFTVEHEVGHYFSILHPFNGWECDQWDGAKHGNPLTLTTAPCTSLKPPYNNILVEFADGSNATNAGDLLADTPADYNLGLGWDDCNYNGGAKDKNGVPLNPDENNIMGYFLQCSDYYFSTQQKAAINADLSARKNVSPNNNKYLNVNTTPELQLPGIADAVFPLDGGVSNGNVGVKLEWQADAGAKSYVVRIDRFTSFKFMPRYYYVNTPQVTLDFDLIADAKYYWQVYSYNEYRTCEPWSPIFSFNASLASSVSSINGLESFALRMQPLPLGQQLDFQAAMVSDLTVDLSIVDMSGRIIHQENKIVLSSGEQQYTTQWAPTHGGVYFIRLQSENGIHTEKLVVQ